MNRRHIGFSVALFLSFFSSASVSHAAVLFSANAESGTCNTLVPFSAEWDYRGDGGDWGNPPQTPDPTIAQFEYLCDTPVPGTSKYFRVDTRNYQHGAYNIAEFG